MTASKTWPGKQHGCKPGRDCGTMSSWQITQTPHLCTVDLAVGEILCVFEAAILVADEQLPYFLATVVQEGPAAEINLPGV